MSIINRHSSIQNLKLSYHLGHMSLHIGNLIKQVVKTSGLTRIEFAKQIHTSRSNLYVIFNRASINTEELITISQVLNHNFFWDIARSLDVDLKPNQLPPTSENSELEYAKLTLEVEYLRKRLALVEEEKEQLQQKIKDTENSE